MWILEKYRKNSYLPKNIKSYVVLHQTKCIGKILRFLIILNCIFSFPGVKAQVDGIVLEPIPFGELHSATNPKVKGSLLLTIANTDNSYYFLILEISGWDSYDKLPLDGSPFMVIFHQYQNASYYPLQFTVKTKTIEKGISSIYAVREGYVEGWLADFYRKKHYCPIDKIVYFTANDGIVEFKFEIPKDKLEYYRQFKDLYNQSCNYWKTPLADREDF